MDVVIRTLSSLDAAETAALATNGVMTREDLSMITFEDITYALPDGTSVVKRRRLSLISQYLARGQTIDVATTMPEIINYLNTPPVPIFKQGPPVMPPPPPPPDPTRGALRLYVNSIEEYLGSPIDFEDWELKTRATIGQMAYARFLGQPPVVGDILEQTRNNELYNMLTTASALMDGSGMHILTGVNNQDGHGAWTAINAWYGLAATSRTIIDHYWNKLESLRLSKTSQASTYVNDFIICCQKLDAKNEGYTTEMKRQRFLHQIVDDSYDVAKQQLAGDLTIDFHGCFQRVRNRKQDLLKAKGEALKKARRFKKNEESDSEPKKEGSSATIPSIPSYILYKIKPENVKKDLIWWRGIYNSEKRIIRANELTAPAGRTDGKAEGGASAKRDGDDSETHGSGKGRNSRGGKGKKPFKKKARRIRGKLRRTATQPSGTSNGKNASSTVHISMKDDDEDESKSGDENDDNEDRSGQDEISEEEVQVDKPRKKKKKQSKARHDKSRRNAVSRRGRTGKEKPRGNIYPGTEIDVIGGTGWHVVSTLSCFNMTAQLDRALAGMGERSLPLVRVVTAYDHSTLGTILLGVRCAGYNKRAEQTESLFNSHNLRKNGIFVNDTMKRVGGEQRLTVDGIHVELDFVDQKTLSFKLRTPTTSELDDLTIHWLSPRRLDLSSSKGNAVRRSPAAIVPSQAPWEERLGNSPEMITVKTLEATTQLCESPVEMDKRESPRQHRKQRVQALHPKRIEGRTDSDTFFVSIKSVRNYACVQIFYSALQRYIFVPGMRKESESHGAYQDLVREVGTPNILLTDNGDGKTDASRSTSFLHY
jgi:hypothetical protein